MPKIWNAAALQHSERYFFVAMALGIVSTNIVMFTIAFMRTNIAAELHSTWVKAHVFAFSCWILLFLTQAILAATERRDFHAKTGIVTAYVAGLMVALTILSGLGVFLHGPPRPAIDTLMLSVFVHVDMVNFTILATLGFLNRRKDPAAHRRFMLLATITVGWRFPVLGSLLGIKTLPHYVDQDVLVLVAILYDLVSQKCVNWAYIWGGLVILILPPAADFIFRTAVPHLVVR